MKISKLLSATALLTGLSMAVWAGDSSVMLTPEMGSVEIKHGEQTVTLQRNQDPKHTIEAMYAKTSRACPPFCIQPMHIAPGVETVGELEVIEDLQKISAGDTSLMVVDSRTPDWLARGTIPGSVNIPWTRLNLSMATAFDDGTVSHTFEEVMIQDFGAQKTNGEWRFDQAKTLVLFCNGIWCPQSATNIKTLLKYGYPPEKLKWYRGGIQSWVSVGLTTVRP